MRLVTLVASSALCLLAPVYGSTITSLTENFNELTPALGVISAGQFMTINGTNVDIVGGALDGSLCASPEAGNCIDMDGTNGNPVGQLESVNTFAAGTYLLSFDLIGNQRGGSSSVTVTLGNFDHTFVLPELDNTDGIVVNAAVTLSAPGQLLFVSNDPAGDQSGELLDNVVVSPANSSVPEPSSLILAASALLALGIVMVRRRVVNN
jgi:adhesin HecA-like repeat protein